MGATCQWICRIHIKAMKGYFGSLLVQTSDNKAVGVPTSSVAAAPVCWIAASSATAAPAPAASPAYPAIITISEILTHFKLQPRLCRCHASATIHMSWRSSNADGSKRSSWINSGHEATGQEWRIPILSDRSEIFQPLLHTHAFYIIKHGYRCV